MTNELTFAREMVTAYQAAVLAHAQGNPVRKSYAIAGRSIEFGDPETCRKELQYWTSEVRKLESIEAVAAGQTNQRRLYIRTSRP
jgi:predicted NAD/FAD-binding protein